MGERLLELKMKHRFNMILKYTYDLSLFLKQDNLCNYTNIYIYILFETIGLHTYVELLILF